MDTGEQLYGIRAVVQRTGLGAPTIRMWERRYGAVKPQRTESNRRRYSEDDVARLALLQRLTKHGHAISSIAGLGREPLEARLAEAERLVHANAAASAEAREALASSLVLTVGPRSTAVLADGSVPGTKVVASFDDLSLAVAAPLPEVDLAVIDCETMMPETVAEVRGVLERCGRPRAVLSYHFASSKTATALARAVGGLTLLQAPVSERQLRRECLLHLSALRPQAAALPFDAGAPLPERLYSQAQLTRLSRLSATVECECPQHLASLLQSLSAFEKYSSECEDRNPDDARLHAFLHRTTAQARRTMEEALCHVVLAEGIEID